jgi:hypothetical protein
MVSNCGTLSPNEGEIYMKILFVIGMLCAFCTTQAFSIDDGSASTGNSAQGGNWPEGKRLLTIYCPEQLPFDAVSIKFERSSKSAIKLWDGKVIQFNLTGCEVN